MVEIIRQKKAHDVLPFDGERFTSAVSGQIEVEHLHRYLLARDFCRGKSVLDIASGEGYGSALLAQTAQNVIGIDINESAVAHARKEFVGGNLKYIIGNAQEISLEDDSIDVIVSFETIEHLENQDKFLSEVKRLLRKDGLLILSTPDKNIYSGEGRPSNPFHIHEMSFDDFEKKLSSLFSHVSFLNQRPFIGSGIISHSSGEGIVVFDKARKEDIISSEQLLNAPYIIAFASSAPLPEIKNSIYIARDDLDTDMQERQQAEKRAIAATAAYNDLQSQFDLLKKQEKNARDEMKRASTHRRKSEQAIQDNELVFLQKFAELSTARKLDRDAWKRDSEIKQSLIHDLSASLSEAQSKITAIERSFSWRISGPIRGISNQNPKIAHITRRILRKIRSSIRKQAKHSDVSYISQSDQVADAEQLFNEIFEDANPNIVEKNKNSSSYNNIYLNSSNEPIVSIVIPTYGQDDFTYRCLYSILDFNPRTAFEVIVYDDAFPYLTSSALPEAVQGVRFIRAPQNGGFLKACNNAAKMARGDYIFFLNNDTELKPYALDTLADLLSTHPDIGMTGSKLIYPDNSLQEAGGIIWQDAHGWNWGRGDSIDKPAYNYRREVDYISGAAIMIRRSLFEALGGFDEFFAPAYYEDTDLAFRVRQQGYKVVYEPRSVVVHYEGISHGTDESSGVKAHQVTNRQRMFERWKDVLEQEHFANSNFIVRARDRAKNRKIILVIDHYVPEPDRDAGSRSIMGTLESLVAADWIVKFWPQNRAYSPTYTPTLENMGIEVVDHRYPQSFENWLSEYDGFLDCVLVSRPFVAVEYLPALIARKHLHLCFYGHDLHFLRLRREAVLLNDPIKMEEAQLLESLERRIWRLFDTSIYLSSEEKIVAKALEPNADIRVITPYCFHDFSYRIQAPQTNTILFVAGFAHPPNEDAAVFLVKDIFPLILQKHPSARILLVGSHPTQTVRNLASDKVEVTGWVSDSQLNDYYLSSRAAVVPLRFGAGIKGKVVEALHQGIPLTTTSIGAEGIEGLSKVTFIADTAEEIAYDLVLMLSDDNAWLTRSNAQTRFAENNFSFDAMKGSITSALCDHDNTESFHT
ncbi:methyltransferase domain-containing protein [Kozakia baliensis]|uniref:methyltransferase domain-containing protein n=1 Tax=Kozakia baliensis TaxID=153496 RepID=UPI00345C44EF